MAVSLSAYGLGPLASEVGRIGTQVTVPGPVDLEVRARIVEGLLRGVEAEGGIPLEPAEVRVAKGIRRIEGELMLVAIWTGSITFAR